MGSQLLLGEPGLSRALRPLLNQRHRSCSSWNKVNHRQNWRGQRKGPGTYDQPVSLDPVLTRRWQLEQWHLSWECRVGDQ